MQYKTRVIKYGAFWKVQVFRCGAWQTMRDNYLTRKDARKGRNYWANY